MVQVPGEGSAIQRARWLAELSKTLDEARRVVKQLGAADGQLAAVELYTRIEAIRLEIEALRLGRRYATREEFDPKWIRSPPWERRSGNGR
jgi:hypothetical protein